MIRIIIIYIFFLTLVLSQVKAQSVCWIENDQFVSMNLELMAFEVLNESLGIGPVGQGFTVMDETNNSYIVIGTGKLYFVNANNGQITKTDDIPYGALSNPILFDNKIFGMSQNGFESYDLTNDRLELLNPNIKYDGFYQSSQIIDKDNERYLWWKLRRRWGADKDTLISISLKAPYEIIKTTYEPSFAVYLNQPVYFNNSIFGLSKSGFIKLDLESGIYSILNDKYFHNASGQGSSAAPTFDYVNNSHIYYKKEEGIHSLISLSTEDGRVIFEKKIIGPIYNPEFFVSIISNTYQEDFSHSIQAYPNPSKGILFINSDKPIKILKLISVSGLNMLQVSPNKMNLTLDVSSIPKGCYVLNICFSSLQCKTLKIFIE